MENKIWKSTDYKLIYDKGKERIYVDLIKYEYITSTESSVSDYPGGYTYNEDVSQDVTLTNYYTDDAEVLDALGVNDGDIEQLLDIEENRIKLCDKIAGDYLQAKAWESLD